MNEKVKHIAVRNLRKKKKISVKDMVLKLKEKGITLAESTYYRKEIGTIPIIIDEAKEIADILNCNASIFFKK